MRHWSTDASPEADTRCSVLTRFIVRCQRCALSIANFLTRWGL